MTQPGRPLHILALDDIRSRVATCQDPRGKTLVEWDREKLMDHINHLEANAEAPLPDEKLAMHPQEAECLCHLALAVQRLQKAPGIPANSIEFLENQIHQARVYVVQTIAARMANGLPPIRQKDTGSNG